MAKTKFLLYQTEDGEFPPSVFHVTPDKRHRFRLANAGGNGIICPISIHVEGHTLRVIALDGSPVVPRDVHYITLAAGMKTVTQYDIFEMRVT